MSQRINTIQLRYFYTVKWLYRITDLVLYTNLFTAVCAVGLFMATESLVNGAIPLLFSLPHIMVLGGTLMVYNAPRILYRMRHPNQPHPLGGLYIGFFFAGLVLLLPGFFFLPWRSIISGMALTLLTLAYSLPMLPFKNKKRIRDYGLLKILLLAGMWTIVTSVLPIYYWHKSISTYPVEVMMRFVFIFPLCIIFDIRDMHTDQANKIDTLPHKLGLINSYRLIDATLVLFVVLGIIQYFRHPVMARIAGVVFTALMIKLVIAYLARKPSDRAYLLLADGVMLFYAGIVILG